MATTLFDSFGRKIDYLRLSVTDQCHFRCVYCLPPDGAPSVPHQEYLNVSEIIRLASLFCDLGIKKIRLTGGEPLLRKDIVQIVSHLKKKTKVQKLAMTTNGSLFSSCAFQLKEAGLDDVNISLDSLKADNFAKLTLRNSILSVWAGIQKAIQVGFRPKINVVVMKGLNDHEIPDFIELAFKKHIEEVRFIEFMPLCGSGWKPQHVFDLSPTIKNLQEQYHAVKLNEDKESVSESYLLLKKGKTGRVGFIRTLSKPFCGNCSRVRVSAVGDLKPCLFSHQFSSLKPYLKDAHSDEEIKKVILETILKKWEGNEFSKHHKDQTNFAGKLYQKTTDLDRNHNPSIRAIGG